MTAFFCVAIVGAALANIAYYWVEFRVIGHLKLYRSPTEMFRILRQYSENAKAREQSPLLVWTFWISLSITFLGFLGAAATLNQR